MSLIKKLAGETAIYGLSSIIGRVVNWVLLTYYLTHKLGQGEYGVYGELYVYIALLLVLFVYRMDTALFRFGSRAKEQKDSNSADDVFTTASLGVMGVTFALTAVLLLFASEIATAIGFSGRIDYVRLFILITALDALAAVPFARLRLDSRPIRFASIKIAAILTNILFLFFFLEGCPYLLEHGFEQISTIYNPERQVAYIFWANLLASGLTLLWLLPLYKGLVGRFVKALWSSMFKYSWPLVIAALAATVNQLIGIPLLKFWSPGTQEANEALVGIYTAAARLAVLMNLFIQAFNYAAEPFFFKQAASSKDRQIYVDVARAFAMVGSFAFVGIMLYLDLIQHFLGESFREGLGVLPILLVGNFFLGLFYNFAMSYKLTDHTQWGGYIAMIGVVITLTINYFLIPTLSYYGPAWASLSCYAIMTILAYFVSKKLWPVDYRIGKMTYYLIWGLALWGMSLLVRPFLGEQLWLIILTNTGILITGLVLLYKTEGDWLRKIITS